ncbi:uncharacterized protein LOC135381985 [Ornithodoros turicata]|uniref:uncharacterized protein LOC135381985 n=1 Tax=Ornithodoros turicata TaxID=34597 RepID=UPI003139AA6E
MPSKHSIPSCGSPQPVVDLNTNPLDITGVFYMKISVPGTTTIHPVYVVRGILHECILGCDFLVQHRCAIDFASRTLKTCLGSSAPQPITLTLAATSVLRPHSHRFLDARTQHTSTIPLSGPAVVEPRPDLFQKKQVLATFSLSDAHHSVSVLVSNPSSEAVTLYKGTTLASLHLLHQHFPEYVLADHTSKPTPSSPLTAAAANSRRPWRREDLTLSVQCTQDLVPRHRNSLLDLIYAFEDIVSQGDWDLGRTSLTRHTIDTQDAPPIKQRPRRMPPNGRDTPCAERCRPRLCKLRRSSVWGCARTAKQHRPRLRKL